MVVTPNYLCFDCTILKRKEKEKNYEDINTTVSFSVSLLSFNGLYALYNST